MASIETRNVDGHHSARVVQAELEPGVVSEVRVESLESPSVIILVESSIVVMANWHMRSVGLPVNTEDIRLIAPPYCLNIQTIFGGFEPKVEIV